MRDEKNDWRDGLRNAIYTLLISPTFSHVLVNLTISVLLALDLLYRRSHNPECRHKSPLFSDRFLEFAIDGKKQILTSGCSML